MASKKGILSVIFEKIYEIFFTSFFAIVLIIIVPTRQYIQTDGLLLVSALIVFAFVSFYLIRHKIVKLLVKLLLKKYQNKPATDETQ